MIKKLKEKDNMAETKNKSVDSDIARLERALDRVNKRVDNIVAEKSIANAQKPIRESGVPAVNSDPDSMWELPPPPAERR